MQSKSRQSMSPVSFDRTNRNDDTVCMTSGDPGEVILLGHVPVLRGDSASGEVTIAVDLAEMPRPLANAVRMKVQAWFVPKAAFPQFAGYDEFLHSYQGEQIRQLGAPARNPPNFFSTTTVGPVIRDSDVYRTLGLHVLPGDVINLDLPTAFVSAYNFRLQAHSSKLPRRAYPQEDMAEALSFPPAFWPRNRFSDVVADYERALIVGALDLDVSSGEVTVNAQRIGPGGTASSPATINRNLSQVSITEGTGQAGMNFNIAIGENLKAIFDGDSITTSLADIDKARVTQAFAKLRSAYAGNNPNGFVNDDALIAELMQGFRVPEHLFKRPWLLDSKDAMFGMVERHATDAGNLDQSVSQGVASARLAINLPVQDTGGEIIYTVEVLPERIYERQLDHTILLATTDELPDALRDVQRTEPVDTVVNRRLDVRHTTPSGLYGYEPMNAVWRRSFTRLGGQYYQADPSDPFTEQRSAIWQPAIVDPAYTADHFLAPAPFPKNVFADTTAPAFEIVARHNLTISGITQFGDVLHENNDEFQEVEE